MFWKTRNRPPAVQNRLDVTATVNAVEQHLRARRFKDALKLAKILFNHDQAPAHRLLVERSYFGRLEQLYRAGMQEGAAQVAANLLEFKVTDQAILAQFLPYLPELGLGQKAAELAPRIEAPDAIWSLQIKAADQAVLHPEKIGLQQAELRLGALAVRGALAALDAGNEPLAQEQLREIPRSSPFADWRLFVRGLAALRRGEVSQIAPNWERLEPNRAAYRIAQLLRPALLRPASGSATAAPSATGAPQTVKINWTALETKTFGEPLAKRLEELEAAVRKQHWREFRRLLGPLVQSLRRIDVRLARRLTELLLRPVVDAEFNADSDFAPGFLVDHLISVAEPCSLDRRWSRLRAIVSERDVEEQEEACTHWTQYAKDIESLSHLTVEDRRKMQGLVYRHIAEMFALETISEDDSPFARPIPKNTLKKMQKKAVAAMEESLRLDPSARKSYDVLASFYDQWSQPEQVAATAQRLLAVCPDDVPTMQLLIDHHIRRQEPEQAFPLVERARRLKPLDERLANDELRIRQGLAREHALRGRWEEGRSEFARVQSQWIERIGREGLVARMAAFEFKAGLFKTGLFKTGQFEGGQFARAEELLREGQSLHPEPAGFWLSMSIESTRYKLGAEFDSRFSGLLKTSLAKKVRGETAARLSAILGGYFESGIEYAGRAKHSSSVVACLKRSTTGKLNQGDLIAVCEFLSLLPHEAKLYDKLVRKGVKAYPDSVYFLVFDAQIEFDLGPYEGNVQRMRKNLERAHELIEKNQNPHEAVYAEKVKKLLGLVRTLTRNKSDLPDGFPGGPFGGMPGGMPDLPRGMFEMFNRVLDEMQDEEVPEEGDDFSFFFDPQGRGGRPKRKSR